MRERKRVVRPQYSGSCGPFDWRKGEAGWAPKPAVATIASPVKIQKWEGLVMNDSLGWLDRSRLEASEGWLMLRNWHQAKAELDKISLENRGHLEVLKQYSEIFEVSKDHEANIVVLEQLTRLAPDEVDYWLRLNAAQLFAGRYLEARERLEFVMIKHPHHPALLFKLAVTMGALQQYDEAEWILADLFTLEGGKYESVYLGLALSWNELAPLREHLLALQDQISKPDDGGASEDFE